MPTSIQPAFSRFAELQTYLDSLGLFRMQPGLDRMKAVLEQLRLRRPPFMVVQVVGTNGKGSTSTMLAALAESAGLRTGLHTSPHFLSPVERIRINGRILSETVWTGCANRIMQAGGEALSYFEFITALAVVAFAQEGANAAVMETGLGGNFDATTALAADMVVFTPIGLDHQTVLGPTLTDIALDKAGAVRPGVPVVSALQEADVWNILARTAAERKACLVTADKGLLPESLVSGEVQLRLTGKHQLDNAALALTAWRALSERPLPPEHAGKAETSIAGGPQALSSRERAVREKRETAALVSAWLPGRMQDVPPLSAKKYPFTPFIPPAGNGEAPAAGRGVAERPAWAPCSLGWPPLLLDGAHNAHAFRVLGHSLSLRGIGPGAVIFSCLADKDPEQVIPHLRSLATGPIFIPPILDNPRAASPDELAARIGLNAFPVASIHDALIAAAGSMAERMPEVFDGKLPSCPLLICGSLYLLSEFFALRPDCLQA